MILIDSICDNVEIENDKIASTRTGQYLDDVIEGEGD